MTNNGGDFLTIREAADALGMTSDAIRSRVKRGSLEGKKQGRAWLVNRQAIESLMDARPVAAPRDTDAAARIAAAEARAEALEKELAWIRDQLETTMGEREAEYRRHATAIEAERNRHTEAIESERARLAEAMASAAAEREQAADERARVLALAATMTRALPDSKSSTGRDRSSDRPRRFGALSALLRGRGE